jgi:DNA-binding XRE family transcriptional regulator
LITHSKKKIASASTFLYGSLMRAKSFVDETDLASLARKFRIGAGKNRAEAARELGVARQSVIYAEDRPQTSFTKLRCRMIEAYSSFKVKGPVFLLERK